MPFYYFAATYNAKISLEDVIELISLRDRALNRFILVVFKYQLVYMPNDTSPLSVTSKLESFLDPNNQDSRSRLT